MTDPTVPFNIGLVQAGAISAGAYTAGVVDFLIEALDEWEGHRGEPGVPQHEVRLKVISGASAGAMTAAIAAVALASETKPVRCGDAEPAEDQNRLYDAWVRRIDIRHLLATSDLEGDQPIRSLLNATILPDIAREAILTIPRAEPRRYVDWPLPVVFTVSNLRGVPYGFKMYVNDKYVMMNHMDSMRFHVGRRPAADVDPRHLDPLDLCGRTARDLPAEWQAYIEAALASGAFPIGLAARHLRRPARDYQHCEDTGICKGAEGLPDPYGFVAVDGGLMDNEPLKLARIVLCGGIPDAGAVVNQYGLETKRALVLIDPFPNVAPAAKPYEEDDRLVAIAGAMFSALKDQARFHPDELALAENEDVFSRYAISPVRRAADGSIVKEKAMCSSCLGGFGGFLDIAFRRYDFHLGRRNCQRFLERYFHLPEENRLFAKVDRTAREAAYVRDRDGRPIERPIGVPEQARGRVEATDGGRPHRFLPIIPLCGTAQAEVMVPEPFPEGLSEAAWHEIETLIRRRVKALGRVAIDSELPKVLGKSWGARAERWAFKHLLWPAMVSGQVTDKVLDKVKESVPIVH